MVHMANSLPTLTAHLVLDCNATFPLPGDESLAAQTPDAPWAPYLETGTGHHYKAFPEEWAGKAVWGPCDGVEDTEAQCGEAKCQNPLERPSGQSSDSCLFGCDLICPPPVFGDRLSGAEAVVMSEEVWERLWLAHVAAPLLSIPLLVLTLVVQVWNLQKSMKEKQRNKRMYLFQVALSLQGLVFIGMGIVPAVRHKFEASPLFYLRHSLL